MYLTAQRVRSRDGREGVNSYLYLHLGQSVPAMAWTHPDVKRIADDYPGTVVVQRLEHNSGGNDVLSFLDIAAADELGPDLIKSAIVTTPDRLTQSAQWSVGQVAFRFFRANANPRADHLEYESLRAHALFLLKPRPVREAIDAGLEPLEILMEDQEGLGVIYRLSEEMQQRVRTVNPNYVPASIRVAYEDRKNLVSVWGEDTYDRQIALALTGLTSDALSRVGPVVVRDVHHQLSPEIIAGAEEIDGQLVGDWYAPDDQLLPRNGWPSGGLLVAGGYALDLVFVERAWYPLSVSALGTYLHSVGLQRGERWRFVARRPRRVFEVALATPTTRDHVRAVYGDEAAHRSRPDRATIQLLVTELI